MCVVQAHIHMPWYVYGHKRRQLCFTSLDTGSYIVYCCEHQANWPVSFWGFSCLCLLYPCGSTEIADVCVSMSDFYVTLGIWTLVVRVAHWFISVINFQIIGCTYAMAHILGPEERAMCANFCLLPSFI